MDRALLELIITMLTRVLSWARYLLDSLDAGNVADSVRGLF